MAYCPNCGGEVNVDARYCPHCGRPAGPVQPTASIASVQSATAPAVVGEGWVKPRSGKTLWVFAAIVLVAALAVLNSGPGSSGGSGSEAATVTERPTAAPTRPPWPEDWDTLICYGLDQLTDAGGHLTDAIDASASFDFDGAIEEAEQAATDAREAEESFGFADNWQPMHSANVYFTSASQHLVKAANLYILGWQTIDPSLIDEANKFLEKSTYQLGRAQTATEPIASKYGGFC